MGLPHPLPTLPLHTHAHACADTHRDGAHIRIDTHAINMHRGARTNTCESNRPAHQNTSFSSWLVLSHRRSDDGHFISSKDIIIVNLFTNIVNVSPLLTCIQ